VKWLEVDPWAPRADQVASVAGVIRQGGLVALPTDTTWGVVCDALQPAAVARLTELRARMRGREDGEEKQPPMSLLCADLSMVGSYAQLTQPQFRLLKRILPGPYTVLLTPGRQVPRQLHTRRQLIGVRIPDHPCVEAIMASLEAPLLVATARLPDGTLLGSSGAVGEAWGRMVDAVVDMETWQVGASTVLQCDDEGVLVVREGLGALEPAWRRPGAS
jgi:tRNA threonylcarbamoyl adenosine modification protein (Sua5/YciO/YrdC/YwlC family)